MDTSPLPYPRDKLKWKNNESIGYRMRVDFTLVKSNEHSV